jgi:hypothetical protein
MGSPPIGDPYFAVMELLNLPLAVTLVVVTAAVRAYARPPGGALSLAAGVITCVHLCPAHRAS